MKIRGNVVGTNLRPETNMIKSTNLTPEEQAQIRANIGAAAVGQGGGGLSITDDGAGNVVITASAGVSITDDGNGNVTIE